MLKVSKVSIKKKKGKDKSLEEIIKTISRFDRGIKDMWVGHLIIFFGRC